MPPESPLRSADGCLPSRQRIFEFADSLNGAETLQLAPAAAQEWAARAADPGEPGETPQSSGRQVATTELAAMSDAAARVALAEAATPSAPAEAGKGGRGGRGGRGRGGRGGRGAPAANMGGDDLTGAVVGGMSASTPPLPVDSFSMPPPSSPPPPPPLPTPPPTGAPAHLSGHDATASARLPRRDPFSDHAQEARERHGALPWGSIPSAPLLWASVDAQPGGALSWASMPAAPALLPSAQLPAPIPLPADLPQHPSAVAVADECAICMGAERTHILIPCGHLCVCGDCSGLLMATAPCCPICRAAVQKTCRVYK